MSVALDHSRNGPSATPFDFGDLVGEVGKGFAPIDEEQLRRAIDPGSATESIHWGRNYLYVTPWKEPGGLALDPVVVKQFRNAGLKARLRRQRRGTKAERSFRVAQLLEDLRIGTARPVLFADSKELEGPAFYLCQHLEGLLESRYLLRSLQASRQTEDYPQLDVRAVFAAFGAQARDLHKGRIWHRDLTCGNLLIDESQFLIGRESPLDSPSDHAAISAQATHATHGAHSDLLDASGHRGLYLLDLNRARTGKKLSLSERMRDLCRLEIPERYLDALWSGYWRREDNAATRRVGESLRSTYATAFLMRNKSKANIRGVARRVGDMVLPRRKPHAHIPATSEVSAREKIVWDNLSDQPHQHASKWEKLRVRIVDFPEHAAFLTRAARAYPALKRRYREIEEHRFQQSVTMDGFGVCVRPWSHDFEAVASAIRDLGVDKVLLRLHPWQQEHHAELDLACVLAEQGVELAFSLPQDRSLVRDPERWRASVAELAKMFAPLGETFQIGQAINRSKWGVWKPSEYYRLFELAAAELRAVRPDVKLIGPGVIDFEFHQTAGYAFSNRRSFELDGLASLLYVDRRGAPENAQMGLDSVGKGAALQAIAEAAPRVKAPHGLLRPLNWVTEVNWPLWEGPHSPAGRDVAVDEKTQAHYLARYYLAMLASGTVDRVYWWQLIAKGYGLIDWKETPDGSLSLRRRPAFVALQTLVRELKNSRFSSWVGTAGAGQWLLRFERPPLAQERSGEKSEIIVAGWSTGEKSSAVDLPSTVSKVCGLDGEWHAFDGGRRARLRGEVQLFLLA